MHRTHLPAAAILAFFPASAASAQQATVAAAAAEAGAAGAAVPVPGDAAEAHPDPDQAIVVTGVRRSAGDILGGVSVVDKEALTHDVRTSIGETLKDLPGVTSSSFGPTASRPILRGLS